MSEQTHTQKNPNPPDPCGETKPPETQPPDKTPCPPPEKCPPPKPCPEPPSRPPDPCGDVPPDKPSDPGQQPTDRGQQPPDKPPCGDDPAQKPAESTGTGGATSGGGSTPASHLAELKKKWEDGQKKLQQLEPLKTEMADLKDRIQAFEKLVDGQSASESAYKDFYKATQLLQSDLDCFIPTARCQIEISDKAKQCVCDAIDAVNARVKKAKQDAADQKKVVEQLEWRARKAARDLEWTKKWHDFLKSGLQQQITKQRDDLKALKTLVTPTANPCEAYFHLYELERLSKSKHSESEACWKDDIWVSTYLDCWPWENYQKAWNRVLVEFNLAEAADKLVKSQLEQAKKLAETLDKAAADAKSKRREWILKEIKTKDCCGPQSKCP